MSSTGEPWQALHLGKQGAFSFFAALGSLALRLEVTWTDRTVPADSLLYRQLGPERGGPPRPGALDGPGRARVPSKIEFDSAAGAARR